MTRMARKFELRNFLESGQVFGNFDRIWELEIPAVQSGDHSGGKCRS